MGRPKKYHTDEERREAARQRYRKYYNANREALNARRTERDRKKRVAMKAGQKETRRRELRASLGNVKNPAPSSSGGEIGWRGG